MNAPDSMSMTTIDTPARRRAWPWVLLGVGVLVVLAGLAGAAALAALSEAAQDGVHVTVNGEPWQWADVDAEHGVLAFLGLGLALLAVAVIVPVVAALGLGVGLLGAALGIGAALLALLFTLALLTSPLWGVALLLWLLLRRRPLRRPA